MALGGVIKNKGYWPVRLSAFPHYNNKTMNTHRNKASIYFFTLAASLVLACLVLGLSMIIRQFKTTSQNNTDITRAEIYARLGIMHALHYTRTDDKWRDNLSSGTWLNYSSVAQGNYTVTGVDTVDGDLSNNNVDGVVLTSTATLDGIKRTISVNAKNAPLDLLHYAVAGQKDIDISQSADVHGDITSNAKIKKTDSDTYIDGNAEAVETIYETRNITGEIKPGSPAKSFPDADYIYRYYNARATEIPYRDKIEEVLLSSTSNPFGNTNPDGLYKINCDGKKIDIENCRLVGTLLLINPQSDSIIQKGINFQPARSDYPVLMVLGGSLTIQPDRSIIEMVLFKDFSLPGESGYGTPFDVYANKITGLVYSSGDLTLDKDCNITGTVIVAGKLTMKDTTDCYYDSDMPANAPKGFCDSYLIPVSGTWKTTIPN